MAPSPPLSSSSSSSSPLRGYLIDSHVHVFPLSEITSLAWHEHGHPLDAQHSVAEYRTATISKCQQLRGFVFIETDRKSQLDDDSDGGGGSGWRHALDEVAWIARVASGKPRPDEGHEASDASLCLAIVPWAPVPRGPEVLARYVGLALERAGSVRRKITGFRYLLQDKASGVMLQPDFLEGLRWLGRHGYCFELGIDHLHGGIWQLDEAIEMLRRSSEGTEPSERPIVVINHLCKPNMSLATGLDRDWFEPWRRRMTALAAFSNTVVKLSGGFSQMDASSASFDEIAAHAQAWLKAVLRLWGPSRCMFGSDWPVSNIGGGGNEVTWRRWWQIIDRCCEGLSEAEADRIWSGTAAEVYKIT